VVVVAKIDGGRGKLSATVHSNVTGGTMS
jgi:hypothetical protein